MSAEVEFVPKVDVDTCPVNPINADPDDPNNITIYPHLVFATNLKQPTPEKYPQAMLKSDGVLVNQEKPYAGLPETITIDTGSGKIMTAMKRLRTKAQNKIWNDMANYGNHLGEQAIQNLRTTFGALLPNSVKQKRKSDRVEVGAEQLEHREHKKRLKQEIKKAKAKAAAESSGIRLNSPLDPKHSYLAVPSLEGPPVPSPSSSAGSSCVSSAAGSVLSLAEYDAQPPLLTAGSTGKTKAGKMSKILPPTGGVIAYKSQLHPEPTISIEDRFRLIGAEERGMRNTTMNLNLADFVIWSAMQTEYVCNNQPDMKPGLDAFCFPLIDGAKIVQTIREKHSSEVAWKKLGYKHTPKTQLKTLPSGGFIIRDVKGKILVVHFPGIYRPGQVSYYNHALVLLRNKLNPPQNQSDTGAGKRGDLKTYATAANRPQDEYPIGTINLAPAWTSEGQPIGNSRPSKAMIASGGAVVEEFVAVQEHFSDVRSLIMVQNYALYKLAPQNFWAQLEVRTRLHNTLPAVRAVGANDCSVMSGRSYIYNRNTNLHFDEQEPPEALIPLVVMGTCKTGRLAVPGLGIKFDYPPGCMTFIRGRLLQHGVVDWEDDGNRFCIANFNHYQEWKTANVQPVW